MKKFLEWFEKNAVMFQIGSLGYIRTTREHCPLQVYTGKECGYLDAALTLGLSDPETLIITIASDCPVNLTPQARAVRREFERMMRANSQSS